MKLFNKLPIVIGILAIGISSSQVMAQDFNGLYVGVSGGIGKVKVSGTDENETLDETRNSGLFSVLLGGRTTFGGNDAIVIGAETALGYYSTSSDFAYNISGILGYRVMESGLLYARIGYGKLSGEPDEITGEGLVDGSGIIFGGGYEFQFNDRMNFRLDYKNMNYGGEIDTIEGTDLNFSGYEITAAVIWNF